MAETEKRSSREEIAIRPRVGARQERRLAPKRGGGYPDICTISGPEDASPCPRLDELRFLGLGRMWIQIAEICGMDLFLAIWRIMENHSSDGARFRVYVPRLRTVHRYRRNRFIEAMAKDGLGIIEIKARLRADLNEDLSVRHISRIAAGVRD